MEPLVNETPEEREGESTAVPVEDVPENSSSENEEEENECRVCRGPSEEG